MFHLNDNEIIFINKGGSIYKSYDAGISWILKKHYQGYGLLEMHFLDQHTGFIRPDKPILQSRLGIIYTTDGGETWNNQSLSIEDANAFLPVSESKILKSNYDGYIYYLDNFFNDWQQVYAFKTYSDSNECVGVFHVPYGYICQFERTPSGALFALGQNINAAQKGLISDSLSLLLNSNTYGTTWDTVWNDLEEFANGLIFSNDSIGWMHTDSKIYKTTDGGKNWYRQNITGITRSIADIFSIDDNSVFAITRRHNQHLIRSLNSGLTWDIIDIIDEGDYNIHFQNISNGLLFGSDLLKTNNSGETWEKADTSIRKDVYDIDFVNSDVGFALGSTALYSTTDGGKSWVKNFVPENMVYNKPGTIKMIDEKNGWLITYANLYKTTDGGKTWLDTTLSQEIQQYEGLEFYDSLGILYSVAEEISPNRFESKYHYITTDNGKHWRPIESRIDSLPGYFKKMQFIDSNHLWGLNSQGLWLSIDTAKTWQRIVEGNYPSTITCFDFYDSSVGILVRGPSTYFSKDGGLTWKSMEKLSYLNATDLKILGPNVSGRYRVLVISKYGNFYEYQIDKDGTVYSESKKTTYTNMDLHKINVFMKDDFPHVWVAGKGFTILYRKYEKVVTNIEEINDNPSSFTLKQNYPNPFNSKTTITFIINQPAETRLVVYNYLGQKVVELMNAHLNQGEYEIIFDASDLPSGLYLYRLQSGDFEETHKMLLLK